MDWTHRISVKPDVCHGRAGVAGTRVLVSVILDNLASGESPDAIARAYQITTEDISAVLAYAAALAREELIAPGATCAVPTLRLKTDENMHPDAAAFLREHGYNVLTVWDGSLRGNTDSELARVCREERRRTGL
jgi:uncharacterized protein (DUF433 family)